MSKGFLNIPIVALGAYISIAPAVNTGTAMQSFRPQDYLQVPNAGRFNNLIAGECWRGVFDGAAATKANMEISVEAKLSAEFNERAQRWESETAVHSAPGATLLHKDYIAIIAKGAVNKRVIIPLILKRLPSSGADWFFALEHIAECNPASNATTFDEACDAWNTWAQANGFIKEANEVLAA
ncbi:MAG: hypothetical protein ACLQVY_11500 [Limisphaerales bacterium]